MDLDATPLRSFLKVAELKSFTRAAESMNVSQPALSAMMKELERRIGFSLFDRTSRRVSLTREGRAFRVHARRVVIETDWMRQRARDLEASSLRVAVQHHSILVPQRVALTDGFAEEHANETVQVLQLEHPRIYDALREDDVDVALVVEPAERNELSPLHPSDDLNVEIRILAQKPLGLFVPAGHALEHLDRISPEDLSGQEVVSINRASGGAMATATARLLAEWGAQKIRPHEGDPLSVFNYAVRKGILGIDLGWIDVPGHMLEQGMCRRTSSLHENFSNMLMLRPNTEHRPIAEKFWQFALNFFDAAE